MFSAKPEGEAVTKILIVAHSCFTQCHSKMRDINFQAIVPKGRIKEKVEAERIVDTRSGPIEFVDGSEHGRGIAFMDRAPRKTIPHVAGGVVELGLAETARLVSCRPRGSGRTRKEMER